MVLGLRGKFCLLACSRWNHDSQLIRNDCAKMQYKLQPIRAHPTHRKSYAFWPIVAVANKCHAPLPELLISCRGDRSMPKKSAIYQRYALDIFAPTGEAGRWKVHVWPPS